MMIGGGGGGGGQSQKNIFEPLGPPFGLKIRAGGGGGGRPPGPSPGSSTAVQTTCIFVLEIDHFTLFECSRWRAREINVTGFS